MAKTAQSKRAQPAAAISAADAKRAQKSSYIPLKIRFQAWWDGVDATKLMNRKLKLQNPQVSSGTGDDDDPDIKIDQSVDSFAENQTDFELLMSIKERVWGKGLIVPGGQDYMRTFVADADLKSGCLLLDLSAGLGGCGRSLSIEFDAIVEGLEMNEGIAKMGAIMAKNLALDKQAPVDHYLRHNPVLRVNRYECVYGHEAFFRVLDKGMLIDEVWKSLKDDTSFIFTDLVFSEPSSADTETIENWISTEEEAPNPWTMAEYKEALTEKGFELVVFEDETSKYHDKVKEGWENFVETLDETNINRRFVDIMMHEAKGWQHRMAAMKAGHLKFLHVHARRPKPNVR